MDIVKVKKMHLASFIAGTMKKFCQRKEISCQIYTQQWCFVNTFLFSCTVKLLLTNVLYCQPPFTIMSMRWWMAYIELNTLNGLWLVHSIYRFLKIYTCYQLWKQMFSLVSTLSESCFRSSTHTQFCLSFPFGMFTLMVLCMSSSGFLAMECFESAVGVHQYDAPWEIQEDFKGLSLDYKEYMHTHGSKNGILIEGH